VYDGRNTLPIKGVDLRENILEKSIASPTNKIPKAIIPMLGKVDGIIVAKNTLWIYA
jgi:hypothetical protein